LGEPRASVTNTVRESGGSLTGIVDFSILGKTLSATCALLNINESPALPRIGTTASAKGAIGSAHARKPVQAMGTVRLLRQLLKTPMLCWASTLSEALGAPIKDF
jgi:hypothetical protein